MIPLFFLQGEIGIKAEGDMPIPHPGDIEFPVKTPIMPDLDDKKIIHLIFVIDSQI